MRLIAFLTDYAVVDRISNHLNLTFVTERHPPPLIACQELLMAAESSAEYLSSFSLAPEGEVCRISDAF